MEVTLCAGCKEARRNSINGIFLILPDIEHPQLPPQVIPLLKDNTGYSNKNENVLSLCWFPLFSIADLISKLSLLKHLDCTLA